MKNQLLIVFLILFSLLNAYSQNASESANPPVIPYWAFGHWIWEDQENSRKAVEQIVNGYLSHDIPVGAIIIDSPSILYTGSLF